MMNSAWIDEYGKPLVPLDEEKLNGGKPLRIQDQIATDENGRRRFHGAFTGGFSAGYWNTVGSQEGWTPQNFKSSRAEKAAPLGQKPLDFMDEEDLEEFGNAPLSLQNREEDPTIITEDEINLKRVLSLDKSKIIAAVEPEIQARKAEKEKRKAEQFNRRKLYVLQKYGCDTTSSNNVWHSVAEEDIDAAFQPASVESRPSSVPLAPEDLMLEESKTNTFGLGDYTPLSSDVASTSADSDKKRTAAPLEVALGSSCKTLSIRGHAFGVGALEEDDEDIYEREDMSRYDFSLDDRRKKKQRIIKMLVKDDNFVPTEKTEQQTNAAQDVALPQNSNDLVTSKVSPSTGEVQKRPFLKPRPWTERKSRFGPSHDEGKHRRKNLNSEKQNLIPNDKQNEPKKSLCYDEKKKQQLLAVIGAKNFVSARDTKPEDKNFAVEKEADIQEINNATKKIDFPLAISCFKPFDYDDPKQRRYEQFVASNASSEKDIGDFLCKIQPAEMSEWDREMEKKEFIQSRKLYKPLEGVMANRFITGTTTEDLSPTTIPKEIEKPKKIERTVVVVRTTTNWIPSAQLCKRYNIADPSTEPGNDSKNALSMKHRKTSQLSIFDYLEGSVNTKADFVTPVIIPKHRIKPEEMIKNAIEVKNATAETSPSTLVTSQPAKRMSRWNVKNPEEIRKDPLEQIHPPEAEDASKTSENGSHRLKFVPKTERNIEKDLPSPVQNHGLFQAIFGENDEEEEETRDKQMSSSDSFNILEQPFISTKPKISPAVAANLLRNTSPPRGIFAALFGASEATEENNADNSAVLEPPIKKQRISEEENDLDNKFYGPAVPTNLHMHMAEVVATSQLDAKVVPSEQRISSEGVEIIEQWVERNDNNSTENSDTGSDSSIIEKKKHKYKKSKKLKKSKKSKKKPKRKYKEKQNKSSKH